jgi:hypothetical protein
MQMGRRLSFTRCAVWGVVISGHLLLLLLLSRAPPRGTKIPESDSQNVSVLLLLEVPAPTTRLPAQKPTLSLSNLTQARQHFSPNTSVSSTATEAPPAESPIDWQLEAERSAHAISADSARKEPKCDPSDRPWSILPKCRKPKRPQVWEPETPRAGFDHLIPYVRLGKRCILGLGFFGCAIGKLPEANGHLFDDMHDPDRPRSSVPDVDE